MDKQKMETFLSLAKDSRIHHSLNDRIFALEVMVCSIGASLEGDSRNEFLKTMNAFSEILDPMQDKTLKAISDLNVLSSDFSSLASQLVSER